MVKAIETNYRGYRFRSRLEARWAVFFDALGLDWVYEPEGYHLSDGQLYLPDFFIRTTGMFVEVKGEFPSKDEINRCDMLADCTGKAVLLVSGLPMERRNRIFCWDLTDSSGGSYNAIVTFVWPAGCEAKVISHMDTRVDRDRDLFLKFFTENPVKAHHAEIAAVPQNHFEAAHAARSARFEHGEKGAG